MTVRTVAELLRRFHTDDPADWARDVLDTLGEISASEINSGEADEGQALLAGGDGTADWGKLNASMIDSGEAAEGQVLQVDDIGDVSFDYLSGEYIRSSGLDDAGKALIADGSRGAGWSKVTVAGIDSGATPAGYRLVADGAGGASWQAP